MNGSGLKQIESVRVVKSIDALTDTAEVRMPGQHYGYQTGIEKKIKRHDPVTIHLGYDGNMEQEFTGYVKSVSTDNSVIIACEDSMTLLKKEVKPRAFKNVTVEELVNYVVRETKAPLSVKSLHDAGSVKFTAFQTGHADGFGVLEKLQQSTGLQFYVRSSDLFIAIAYLGELGKEVKYDFTRQKNAVIRSLLKYRRRGERSVQVEVTGVSKTGQRKKVKAGADGGDKFTIYKYDVDFDSLDKIAESEVSRYQTEGYEGDLEVLLVPYCTYGYGVSLYDPQYPERTMHSYFIESVESGIHANKGGYRRISLGKRIS